MPRLVPVSQRKLVSKLKSFGFEGPYQEGKHPYMIKGELSLTIPNQHEKIMSVDLLIRILKQAGVSKIEWVKKK
ncbi:hypothetical protein A3G06_01355 [Candidatus Nomurabacteria bacterium RIFCSPLOWO2_12_FULL_46_14]|uniref:Type II toxin-antitoxin system HicA family toxin n=1 Tax=Candidatus Nomurabacteria bacterium RIFCSPLOWO2_12_FULL_46_14 TaxID=1801797 RepID=A0A1F6Y9C3_9BACT|nr:MAG: hypothetical protein A3G06_01355 [Candidatus Nomurabacteria bacterium RIFCSPLOWO2_12_FULL_46_14]